MRISLVGMAVVGRSLPAHLLPCRAEQFVVALPPLEQVVDAEPRAPMLRPVTSTDFQTPRNGVDTPPEG